MFCDECCLTQVKPKAYALIMDKLSLSLLIITLNEESNIARCIRSASWANDIVVLDSGSTDRTCEIARALGARVYQEEWRGFGPQKRRAVELAKNDWILSLDADEELSPALSREIQALYKTGFTADGYSMARKTFHLGRWIVHGGWYPDRQLRLFNKQKCHWSEDILHEFVIGKNIKTLNNDLNHHAFGSLFEQVQTNNKYSTLAVTKLQEQGRGHIFSMYKLLVKPFVKFIECYFVKFGFMDGMPGFIIAVGAAYSQFLRFAKLWESIHAPIKESTLNSQSQKNQALNSLVELDLKKKFNTLDLDNENNENFDILYNESSINLKKTACNLNSINSSNSHKKQIDQELDSIFNSIPKLKPTDDIIATSEENIQSH